MLDAAKRPIFQLDDTFEGHHQLYRFFHFAMIIARLALYAAVESTGGENNWFDALIKLQSSLPLKTARLNPCGVHNNSAGLERKLPISAENVRSHISPINNRILWPL